MEFGANGAGKLAKNKGGFHCRGIRPRFNDQTSLARDRVWADLEMHHLALLTFAAFDMRGSAIGEGGPQSLTLPAGIRVIDAPIHALGEVAKRIWHAQHNPFALDE